jgi:hypothetical protein
MALIQSSFPDIHHAASDPSVALRTIARFGDGKCLLSLQRRASRSGEVAG